MSAYSSKPRLGQGQVKDYKVLAGKVSRRESVRSQQHTTNAQQQEDVGDGIGGVYKNAAVKILKQEKRLMSPGEITKLALDRRLVSKTSKTPENTMASALYSDVRKRGDNATFFRPSEGLFGLRCWLGEAWLNKWFSEEGIAPEEFSIDPSASTTPPSKRHKTRHSSLDAGNTRSGATSTTGDETDSDDKTSNLNLLLEAADEIDRTENWTSSTTTKSYKSARQSTDDATREAARTRAGQAGMSPSKAWIPAASPQADFEQQPSLSFPQPLPPQSSARPPRPTLNRFVRRSVRSSDPNGDTLQSPLQSPSNLVLQIPNGLLPANGATALQYSPVNYAFLANSLGSPLASPLTLAGPTLFSPQASPATLDASCFTGISPTIMPLTPLGGSVLEACHSQMQGLAMPAALNPSQVQHPPPTMFGDRGLELRGYALSHVVQNAAEREPSSSNSMPQIVNLDLPDFNISHGEDVVDDPEEGKASDQAPNLETDGSHPDQQKEAVSVPDDPAGAGIISTNKLQAQDVGQGQVGAAEAGTHMQTVNSGAVQALQPPKEPAGDQAQPASAAGGAGGATDPAEGPREVEIVHPGQINLTRQHIHLLEKTLGYNHPTVGKAYVYLSRLLMNEGSRWSLTMAKRSLYRSWGILAGLKTQLGATEPPLTFNDFTYLLKSLEGKEGNRGASSSMGTNTSSSQPASSLISPSSQQHAQLNPLIMQRFLHQSGALSPSMTALTSPDIRLHGAMSPVAVASPVSSLAGAAAAYRMLLGQQAAFAGFAPLASN